MARGRTAIRDTDNRSPPNGNTANGRETKRGLSMDVEPYAQSRRVELTPAHLEVVRFLQAYTYEHQSTPDVQELANAMAQHFERQGGRRYLYRLFPKGPVSQASRIAGLDIPNHKVDG